MFYDSSGNLVKQSGSIWNFHSWNDAWMSRPDLQVPYTGLGWQAVDATPQEKSDGVYKMGPTPLSAVKAKIDNIKYDTPFVISEVASVVHNYLVDCKYGSCNVTKDLGIDLDGHIGSLIVSSPLVGDKEMAITADYSSIKSHIPKIMAREMRVKFGDVDVSGVIIASGQGMGQPVKLEVSFFSSQPVSIFFGVDCFYTEYNGDIIGQFADYNATLEINSGIGRWTTYVKDYVYRTPIDENMLFTLFGVTNISDNIITDISSIILMTPPININVDSQNVSVSGPGVNFAVLFTNPLPIPITRVQLKLRAVRMGLDESFEYEALRSGQLLTIKRHLTPPPDAIGSQSIIATLICDQIESDGYAIVYVNP